MTFSSSPIRDKFSGPQHFFKAWRLVRTLNDYVEAAVSSVKEAALISAIDLVVSAFLLLAFGFFFLDTFGIILLVEGAGLLLVGGALGFAGQAGVRRVASMIGLFGRKDTGGTSEKEAVASNDVRAAFYMLTGVVLFLESFALAFLVQ